MYPRNPDTCFAHDKPPVRRPHASRVPARAFRPGLFACVALPLAVATVGGGCWPTPKSHPIVLSAHSTSPDTVSISCDGTSHREIIEKVARHFSLRIDYPADLHGHTSIHLRDVTWRQIFKVTLAPVGYDFYERTDGVVVIRPTEEIRALPAVAAETALHHQTPVAVAAYLRRLDPILAATVVVTPNGITYSAHPQKLEKIRAEITRIDSPDVSLNRYTRPVFLPATIPEDLPVPSRSLFMPGVKLGESHTTEVFTLESVDAFLVRPYVERELTSFPGSRALPDLRVNALIVTAPESRLPRLEAIVRYLDDPRWYDETPPPAPQP